MNSTLVLTPSEAAEVLGFSSERSFSEWLARTPDNGESFYSQLGRDKRFTAPDLLRIRRKMREIEQTIAEPSPQTDGYIYFFAQSDLIKIGWSRDWKRRLVKLQTATPHPITPIGAIPGSAKQEKLLHRHFSEHRTQGEWFKRCDAILDYIAERQTSGLMEYLS